MGDKNMANQNEPQEEKPSTKVVAFRIPTEQFEALVQELKQQGKPISQKDIAELYLLKEKEREKLKAIEEFKNQVLQALRPKEQYFDEFLEEHVSSCPECQQTLLDWLKKHGYQVVKQEKQEEKPKEEAKPQTEKFELLPGVL